MAINVEIQGLDYINRIFESAIENFIPLAFLYAAVVTAVLLWGKKQEKLMFGYPVILFLATVFNPYLMLPVMHVLPALEGRYRRLFWVLPITMVLAWGAVRGINAMKQTWKRLLAAAAILLVIGVCGTPMTEVFQGADNIYKVNNEVIALADILTEDSGGRDINVLYTEGEILELRQYDPAVKSILRRREMLTWNPDVSTEEAVKKIEKHGSRRQLLGLVVKYGKQVSRKKFQRALKRFKTDYVLVRKEFGLEEYMGGMKHLEYVDETDIHLVYRTTGW